MVIICMFLVQKAPVDGCYSPGLPPQSQVMQVQVRRCFFTFHLALPPPPCTCHLPTWQWLVPCQPMKLTGNGRRVVAVHSNCVHLCAISLLLSLFCCCQLATGGHRSFLHTLWLHKWEEVIFCVIFSVFRDLLCIYYIYHVTCRCWL